MTTIKIHTLTNKKKEGEAKEEENGCECSTSAKKK
jgi:hypothetical protein